MLLCCVVLVQLLVHGFVLSYGVLVARVTRRFRVSLVEAGEILTMMTMLTMIVDQEVQGLLGQGRGDISSSFVWTLNHLDVTEI